MRLYLSNVIAILFQADSGRVDADDSEIWEPYMFAHSFLRKCLRFEPQIVHETMARVFEEKGETDDWITVHGLIQCLSVLCSRDAAHVAIGAFVESHGPFLIQASLSPIDRVSDAALTALSAAIEVYGLYVNTSNLVNLVTHIASLVTSSRARPAINALRAIIERFGPEHADSPLPAMSTVIGNSHTAVISSSHEPETIVSFYAMFESYICRLPPDAIELVREFVAAFHGFLRRGIAIDAAPSEFTLHQCVLQTLGTSFRQYPTRLSDLAHDSATLLLAAARASHQRLVAEAFEALVYTVSSLERATEELLSPIWEISQENLQSDDPYLIERTVFLISSLFRTIPDHMASQFEGLVRHVAQTLSNDRYTREFYVNLLDSLAAVVSAMGSMDPEICEFLLTLYRPWVAMPVDVRDVNEVEFANRRYEVLFKGYAAIIQGASSTDFLCAHRVVVELFEPSAGRQSLAERLGQRISDDALNAFLDFLQSGLDHLPKRWNVLLARQKIKALLILAESRADRALNNRAHRLFTRLLGH
jgi:hypothetical protein